MQIYSETIVEAIVLILVGSSLVFIPLYFNIHTVSLHILGPDWDYELSIFGTSMQPTLNEGDFVCVTKIDATLIKASPTNGDIIVFYKPNSSILGYPPIVTHRAVNKTTRNGMGYFETKGDGNSNADDWVDDRGEDYTWNGMISELLLIGKVVGIRRGYAIELPIAIMAVILVSVVITDGITYACLIRKNKN